MKNSAVHIRFLLGPAGSGKTHRCLDEIRSELLSSPEGPPLVLLAPKQATFQLERQLLADGAPPALTGYTRLHILSFERLAHWVFRQFQLPSPELLSDEGRLMVLRAVLARRRQDLKLYRASARLTGFARQLSLVLRELQRHRLTPGALFKLAADLQDREGLALKLQDLALLLQDYLDWLQAHQLQDADCLLDDATAVLMRRSSGRTPDTEGQLSSEFSPLAPRPSDFTLGGLWLDGFAELSPQELDLLAALAPHCENATLAFCLDREPREEVSWLSHWSLVRRTFSQCRSRLENLPGVATAVELLTRSPGRDRFQGNPVLAHLESHWADPEPFDISNSLSSSRIAGVGLERSPATVNDSASPVRLVACSNAEGEAALAAREILRFVRAGGRFREVGVIVRRLEGYHQLLQRAFARYDIPFFLDRRESVAHHPLAELTRSALRLAAFQWSHEDWFAALKTGLVPAGEMELDRLENEALARGWKGPAWLQPLVIPEDPGLAAQLDAVRRRIVPPFQQLVLSLAGRQYQPTGAQLAAALREFWSALKIDEQLERWSESAGQSAGPGVPAAVHATVREQMNAWLDNVALAFPEAAAPLREWLPVLETGLTSLTVGVIPPALDQVLVGAVDRSRNPELNLAIVLGLNETVFPAPPEPTPLLTESDRDELERRRLDLGSNPRRQIGREQYLGYIACTRPRRQLVLTWSCFDTEDRPLNPSPFVSRVKRLFPALTVETLPRRPDWRESEHVADLVAPLLRLPGPDIRSADRDRLLALPGMSAIAARLQHFKNPDPAENLSPELAGRLYGPVLRTSVSRLEQYAACPFRFFVHSGLRAEERKQFELDVREQGSFQHDVLRLFHEQLARDHQRWRDLTPAEARERVGAIARTLVAGYRDGLLEASDAARFTARVLTESLQDFVETSVAWMRGQYRFDPAAVELAFGGTGAAPAWELDLGEGRALALYGRIDRVDLCGDESGGETFCVVVDYKSSAKQLDPVLVEHGVQLQLLAYLNVLRHWPDPRPVFGVPRLTPAGVFYVNLRGKYEREPNRRKALADLDQARQRAYRHNGRFDARVLRRLDSREDAREGDQFNYRLKQDGSLRKDSREALATAGFEALLDSAETNLTRMGREIFSGSVRVAPYRRGTAMACDQCDYQSICRIAATG